MVILRSIIIIDRNGLYIYNIPSASFLVFNILGLLTRGSGRKAELQTPVLTHPNTIILALMTAEMEIISVF